MRNQIYNLKKMQGKYNEDKYICNEEDKKDDIVDEINDKDKKEYCILDAKNGVKMAIDNGLTTVFIRNIPYSTTAKDLGFFLNKKFDGIKKVRILMKKHLGIFSSRGMGFVEFKTPACCIKFLSAQNVEFKAPKSKQIRLIIHPAKQMEPNNTAFIKGIPLETTEEDIINAFQSVKPIKVKIRRYDNDKSFGFAYSESKVFLARNNLDELGRRLRYQHRSRRALNRFILRNSI